MALSRVKNWVAEVLTYSDLNAEFNSILNNPGSLITPITFNLTFTDATYDIGASGATRPRDLFLSRNAVIGGTLTYGGVTLTNAVTGTGKMVLDTSPTLVTPALGTPASGTLTNCTIPGTAVSGTTLAANVVTSSLTTVGALNSGSITNGFGSIDVGADAISGGAISGTTGAFTGVLTQVMASGDAQFTQSRKTTSDDARTVFQTNAVSDWIVGLAVLGGPAASDYIWYSYGTSNNVMSLAKGTGIVTMGNYGAGTATFSAAGVISSVSDERLKIKDGIIKDVIPMLMALEPGYFYGKPEANMGDARQLGFYAQNVRKAIGAEAAPDPVDGKPWGYFDRSVLAVAINSAQNHERRLAALEARLQ